MALDLGMQTLLAEWLFVETVDDLHRRSQGAGERNRYELLGIAPLLRKLLLDGHCLVDTVRATRPEVPTDFRIRQWTPPAAKQGDEGLAYALRLGGSELIGRSDDPALGTLKKFLNAVVGEVNTEPLKVRNIVRYYAHVEGGVHFGKPNDATEDALSVIAPTLHHSTGQIQILAYIGAIVVDALMPLRNSILTSPTIIRPIHRRNESGFYDSHWITDYFAAENKLRDAR